MSARGRRRAAGQTQNSVSPRNGRRDRRFGAGFEASWKVVRGGGKARGRVLRCQAVTASTRTCPSSSTLCLKGSMRNFPRPLIVRVSWSPARRRYEIRAPANPPPHRPRRTPGLHPGGFSDTPLDDPRAPRARDDGTLAKALLPTPSSASLRGLAPGCAGEVIFHARARPRVVDPAPNWSSSKSGVSPSDPPCFLTEKLAARGKRLETEPRRWLRDARIAPRCSARARALSVPTSLNLYQTRQSSNLTGGTSNLTRA